MTDDIVTRLTAVHGLPRCTDAVNCVLCEAVDGIERLRIEVSLKGHRLDDALDEIEQLREERDDWQTAYHQAFNELGLVVDEIEKLRHGADLILSAINNKGSHPEYHDEIRRRHEREWPVLWRAIAALKEARRG